jgi:peptidoglycan/xylan/chitin deacetylase (PgdA/CDA1 family)
MRVPRFAAVFLFAFSLVVASGVATAPAQAAGYSISRGPNTSNKVILTFDDCPKSLSSFKKSVKAFSDMGVRVALFPTGNCIKAGKFDAKYARKMGHYVFNHSITHPDLRTLSYAGVKRELGKPGVVTTYGRPPYGAYNATTKRAYAAVGMKIWTWTVDTNDWRGKSSSQLVSYVVNNARKGDTVLMHMQWNGFNKSTVKKIKSGLSKKGVKLCKNTGTVKAKPSKIKC